MKKHARSLVRVIENEFGRDAVMVGVEVKKLNDVLACMRDGRFAEQLRGMGESYEIKWLLIEGRIRNVSPNDTMQIASGKKWRDDGHYRYQEFTSWLQTMCMRGGVLLWRTENQDETVAWLRSLYLWWTMREYEQHRKEHYCKGDSESRKTFSLFTKN